MPPKHCGLRCITGYTAYRLTSNYAHGRHVTDIHGDVSLRGRHREAELLNVQAVLWQCQDHGQGGLCHSALYCRWESWANADYGEALVGNCNRGNFDACGIGQEGLEREVYGDSLSRIVVENSRVGN